MRSLQIRRRRLARLGALSGAGSGGPASPPAAPAAAPEAGAGPQRLSPAPAVNSAPTATAARSSTEPTTPDATNTNQESEYSDGVSKSEVPDQNKITGDGLIVTEKPDNNLLDEMPDTKMTDLSQTRQYNSFDSMGDDTLLSCGSVRVGSLPQSMVGGSEGTSTREDSTSRSISPAQFAEPSPVRPRPSNVSPSCSRRSLSMEVDDSSEKNSQSEPQQEPMEVSSLFEPNIVTKEVFLLEFAFSCCFNVIHNFSSYKLDFCLLVVAYICSLSFTFVMQ